MTNQKQFFRHWIEVRDIRDGTVHQLPVTVFQRLLLVAKSKQTVEERSPDIRLRVQDLGGDWEVKDLAELSLRLRDRYPDGTFERVLKCERDTEEEEKHRSAMDALVELLAEIAVRELLKGEAGA